MREEAEFTAGHGGGATPERWRHAHGCGQWFRIEWREGSREIASVAHVEPRPAAPPATPTAPTGQPEGGS
jgi:sarcosine oxidase delta subunit